MKMLRRALEPGDLIMCSHGCKAVVYANLIIGETSHLKVELHRTGSALFRHENYPANSTVEILEIA